MPVCHGTERDHQALWAMQQLPRLGKRGWSEFKIVCLRERFSFPFPKQKNNDGIAFSPLQLRGSSITAPPQHHIPLRDVFSWARFLQWPVAIAADTSCGGEPAAAPGKAAPPPRLTAGTSCCSPVHLAGPDPLGAQGKGGMVMWPWRVPAERTAWP